MSLPVGAKRYSLTYETENVSTVVDGKIVEKQFTYIRPDVELMMGRSKDTLSADDLLRVGDLLGSKKNGVISGGLLAGQYVGVIYVGKVDSGSAVLMDPSDPNSRMAGTILVPWDSLSAAYQSALDKFGELSETNRVLILMIGTQIIEPAPVGLCSKYIDITGIGDCRVTMDDGVDGSSVPALNLCGDCEGATITGVKFYAKNAAVLQIHNGEPQGGWTSEWVQYNSPSFNNCVFATHSDLREEGNQALVDIILPNQETNSSYGGAGYGATITSKELYDASGLSGHSYVKLTFDGCSFLAVYRDVIKVRGGESSGWIDYDQTYGSRLPVPTCHHLDVYIPNGYIYVSAYPYQTGETDFTKGLSILRGIGQGVHRIYTWNARVTTTGRVFFIKNDSIRGPSSGTVVMYDTAIYSLGFGSPANNLQLDAGVILISGCAYETLDLINVHGYGELDKPNVSLEIIDCDSANAYETYSWLVANNESTLPNNMECTINGNIRDCRFGVFELNAPYLRMSTSELSFVNVQADFKITVASMSGDVLFDSIKSNGFLDFRKSATCIYNPPQGVLLEDCFVGYDIYGDDVEIEGITYSRIEPMSTTDHPTAYRVLSYGYDLSQTHTPDSSSPHYGYTLVNLGNPHKPLYLPKTDNLKYMVSTSGMCAAKFINCDIDGLIYYPRTLEFSDRGVIRRTVGVFCGTVQGGSSDGIHRLCSAEYNYPAYTYYGTFPMAASIVNHTLSKRTLYYTRSKVVSGGVAVSSRLRVYSYPDITIAGYGNLPDDVNSRFYSSADETNDISSVTAATCDSSMAKAVNYPILIKGVQSDGIIDSESRYDSYYTNEREWKYLQNRLFVNIVNSSFTARKSYRTAVATKFIFGGWASTVGGGTDIARDFTPYSIVRLNPDDYSSLSESSYIRDLFIPFYADYPAGGIDMAILPNISRSNTSANHLISVVNTTNISTFNGVNSCVGFSDKSGSKFVV